MKKIILFATIATIIVASCSKKDSAPAGPSLIGKWSLVNLHNLEIDNGAVIDDDNYTGTAADYVEFKNDNKVYSLIDGQIDVADYQLLPDNKVLIDGETYTIQILTANSTTLYQKFSFSATLYIEVTLNLKR